MNIDHVVSDTCMFLFGTCIGIIINKFFLYIENSLQFHIRNERHEYLIIGVFQVLIDAFCIQYVKYKIQNIGLFVLGLLSSQSLLIKKCYN
jgi:hypothetical protein